MRCNNHRQFIRQPTSPAANVEANSCFCEEMSKLLVTTFATDGATSRERSAAVVIQTIRDSSTPSICKCYYNKQ